MKKFIYKLSDAIAWVTIPMLACLVWVIWYSIAYCSPSLLMKWFLYLFPPVAVVIALVISIKWGGKDDSN